MSRFAARLILPLLLLLAGWLSPIASAEVSRSEGVLAEGTRWQTRYYVIDSGEAGATVMVTGGLHGNEPAGAAAAEQIRHWPIVKGRLIVVPRANVPGLEADTRYLPEQPRDERDLNRNFPGDDDESADATRGRIAGEIWRLTRKTKPGWVLDLHEGYEFNVSHKPPAGKKKSVGSSVIYFQSEAMDKLVARMLAAANTTVTDDDRRFVPLKRGPINTSFARATVKRLGARGMILETTYRDQPLSLRTRQHRLMVNVVLRHAGVIDRDCVDVLTPARQRATDQTGDDGEATKEQEHRRIHVAHYDAGGTGRKANITRVLGEASNVTLRHVGPADIRPAVLKQFDVIVFPGGSGSKQAAAIGDAGREAVREFVKHGGGYVGICAGAYLCSAHYEWSLDLIDTSVFTGMREIEGVGRKAMWYRGGATDVEMQLSDAGKRLFAGVPEHVEVRYQNGPIVSPKGNPRLDDYTVLAWFRSENGLYPPQKGTMIDTPAIVSGAFGRGRVMSISPHPESTRGLEAIVVNSVRWVAKRRAKGVEQSGNADKALQLAPRCGQTQP